MKVLTISETDVDRFDAVILFACLAQSSERFEYAVDVSSVTYDDYRVPDYFYSERCLVISFDTGWYPFLDNTRGYNHRHERWYIPKKSVILAQVARWMQQPDHRARVGRIPGGRVFVHAQGAFSRSPNGIDVPLVNWTLPKESLYLLDYLGQ